MTKSVMKYRFEQSVETKVHKLYVYDDVRAQGSFNWETWSYEESETSAKYFRDRLDEIPDGETIELHVNSCGGEVGEGVTIYNLLRQKAGKGSRIVGYVDGYAYSVAMDIIMACDEIHMGLGTSMLLHNPWTWAAGNASSLRTIADQLDALADASRQLYMSRAKNLTEEELKEMMDKETVLAPDTCLQYGFCDFVGEKEPEEDPEPEPAPDPGDEPDDKEKQMAQLKEQLFRQKQINEMLRNIQPKQQMKDVFKNALEELRKGGKH